MVLMQFGEWLTKRGTPQCIMHENYFRTFQDYYFRILLGIWELFFQENKNKLLETYNLNKIKSFLIL